jgi:hypothetical protein
MNYKPILILVVDVFKIIFHISEIDTVEVSGSTPLVPTRKIKGLGKTIQGPFDF